MIDGAGAVLALVALSAPAAAGEVDLPRSAELPLPLAQRAAAAALEQCRRDGFRVTVAVVDRAGLIKAQLRADGAGAHTLDSSRRKAYTAASLGESTGRLARMVAQRPHLQGLHRMNASILLLGGGFPIRIGGELVGGIGVGGAPGDTLDEACAQAGLAAIGAEGPAATEGPPAQP